MTERCRCFSCLMDGELPACRSANTLLHVGTESFLLQLGLHLGLDFFPDTHKRQLLETTEALPPVLARLVLSYPFEQIGRLHPNVFVLVEEAQADVEQPGMRLRRDGEKETDIIVRMDILGKGQVDLSTLSRSQPLQPEAVMHVVQIEPLEWADCIELGEVLVVGC